MKKITLLIAFIGMITLQSCTVNEVRDNVDNDTIAEVFELRNKNLFQNDPSGRSYSYYAELNPQIFNSDMVLIYRLIGRTSTNAPIWQLIPRTLYLSSGDELDYDYDFSREDFTIYAEGTYNLAETPEYIFNQTFRIVIIPGYFSNRSAQQIDFNDYNAVIQAYGINPTSIKKI